jgi:hypothetical protein
MKWRPPLTISSVSTCMRDWCKVTQRHRERKGCLSPHGYPFSNRQSRWDDRWTKGRKCRAICSFPNSPFSNREWARASSTSHFLFHGQSGRFEVFMCDQKRDACTVRCVCAQHYKKTRDVSILGNVIAKRASSTMRGRTSSRVGWFGLLCNKRHCDC